jgi:hypothetical protein
VSGCSLESLNNGETVGCLGRHGIELVQDELNDDVGVDHGD